MSFPSSWLLLISSLTGQNRTVRMRIWRGLKAAGAGALRDGVYLLPASDHARRVLQAQADEVRAAGGAAQILVVDADAAQQQTFVPLFDRSAENAGLLRRIAALTAGLTRLDEGGARRQLAALQRENAAVAAIDFFPGPSQRQVAGALEDAETAIATRFSPDEPHPARATIPKRDPQRYRGRIWATRERLWVDRVASAWLIRRSIDPQARFVWIRKPKDCPKKALGFDFDGAEFTHVGSRVTFEVLLASFGLGNDRALARIGALVHFLDVGGVAVPEAPGFAAILAGARERQSGDDALLAAMTPVLDDLHAAFAAAASDGN